jgi:hypothetical protein
LVIARAPAISGTTRRITAHSKMGGILPSIGPSQLTCNPVVSFHAGFGAGPDRKTVERLYELGELRLREMDEAGVAPSLRGNSCELSFRAFRSRVPYPLNFFTGKTVADLVRWFVRRDVRRNP